MKKYSEDTIKKAIMIAAENVKLHPKAPEGFWFEGVYIISPFLDKTGQEAMTFEEAVEYYGDDNIAKFMSGVMKKSCGIA